MFAKDAYLVSLKEYERAAWHDETLRELALLIDKQTAASAAASVASGVSAVPRSNAGKTPVAIASPSLPFWLKLTSAYPASPFVPEALFHSGKLELETGQWRPALESFEKLATDHPASPWTGDAYVSLVDVKLERLLDLEGAQKHADAAVKWYESQGHGADQGQGGNQTPRLPPAAAAGVGEGRGERTAVADYTSSPFSPTPPRPIREIGYDIYLRAGLLEYLQEQFGAAVVFFEKAKPLAPPQNILVVYGKIPTGIERLIENGEIRQIDHARDRAKGRSHR